MDPSLRNTEVEDGCLTNSILVCTQQYQAHFPRPQKEAYQTENSAVYIVDPSQVFVPAHYTTE